MLIVLNEEIINIIHSYVVVRLIAEKGTIYFGTVTGTISKVFFNLFGTKQFVGIQEKAGVILYSIVRGHAFTDGNKRTGLLSTLIFRYFNGYDLYVPADSTKFLEAMADAQNPNAPTEIDAIKWVKKNSKKTLFGRFNNFLLTAYVKSQGMGYIRKVTPVILDIMVDKERMVDKKLREAKKHD